MECTLRGIFQEHFEAYAERRRLPLYVHRAAYWISRCRTAELGGQLRRCPEGHVERCRWWLYSAPGEDTLLVEQWGSDYRLLRGKKVGDSTVELIPGT